MYLVPSGSPAINNRKWNLGRLGCNCNQPANMRGIGLLPVRLPHLGAVNSRSSQMWRLHGLGAAASKPPIVWRDAESGWTVDAAGNTFNAQGTLVSVNATPSPVGTQNPSPVQGGASNGGITTVRAAQPSSNALDYVSPQAAIAAGLDPQKVYAKWTAAVGAFSSPQAAIAGGVPAGVVNQLWQAGMQNRAARRKKRAPSWTSFLGDDGTYTDPTTGLVYDTGGGLVSPVDSSGGSGLPFLPSIQPMDTTSVPIGTTLTPPASSSVALQPSTTIFPGVSAPTPGSSAGSIPLTQLFSLQPSTPAPAGAAQPNALSSLIPYVVPLALVAVVAGAGAHAGASGRRRR